MQTVSDEPQTNLSGGPRLASRQGPERAGAVAAAGDEARPLPSATQIPDLEALVNAAVLEVFATMLRFQVLAVPCPSPQLNGQPMIVGAVGFNGVLNGVAYLHATEEFARAMTRLMLGPQEAELDAGELVDDTFGELTNMVVGHLKSRLADRGLSCALTIPTLIRGGHFKIRPLSTAERRIFCFRCDDNQLVAEVVLAPPQPL